MVHPGFRPRNARLRKYRNQGGDGAETMLLKDTFNLLQMS
jgi:hypothetical protein